MNDLEPLKGIACAVDASTEAGKTVWRFRLDTGGGVLIPVEIRGDEIRGSLNAGDEIEVLSQSKDKTGEGVRSKHILNRTTSFEINTYERSRVRRGFSFVQLNFYVGVLAALGGAAVTILIGFLRVAASTSPPAAAGGASGTTPSSGPTPTNASGTPSRSPGTGIFSPRRASLIPLWAYYAGVALPIAAVVIFVIYDLQKNVRDGPGGVLWYLRRRNSLSIIAGVIAGDLLATLITAFLL